MPGFVDDFLNGITMYRLALYYLMALWVAAWFAAYAGVLPFGPSALLVSSLVILATCWVVNTAYAYAFGAATNFESVYITALILVLIIPPSTLTNYAGLGFLVFASAWAMASKYLLAIGKKHIFNPAAFGVALSSFVIGQSATWWVSGNLYLLPVLLVGGVLLVRKLRRADVVWAFTLAVLAMITLTYSSPSTTVLQVVQHSAFFFLAFVMLTEPLTMPPDRLRRVLYGALVGLLFLPTVHIGSFYFTPELALLVGNLFAYLVSPKGRLMLRLVERKMLAAGVYEFAFATDKAFTFRPGQYLEWTLPHDTVDARGNRRYFTIASSPTEREVKMGVKFYESPSSFKRALATMRAGDVISAAHLSGDFVLPHNPKKKSAFIAGGIGVTPFRSMVQYLLDKKERRDIVLFYAAGSAKEFAYKDLFDRAWRELGLRTVYAAAEAGQRITPELIAREVPDYKERTFYISGPRSMVESFKVALREAGVPRWHIKTDFFPGFV